MSMLLKYSAYAIALGAAAFAGSRSFAAEMPVGKPQYCGGMEIAAVYLQPIEMDPAGMMRPVKDSDIHLEADIHATEDNKNGFQEGSWLPYLQVHYELSKAGSADKIEGMFHPMVANDGPHYGENIKMAGAGKYHLKYTVSPPAVESMFGRHIDKETGVAPWFKQCVAEYDFVYAGTGKKGGY
ncbi:iron transporter [Candidatus Tokpelaia sp.]|uniref:iron transporter n=1 Tax=Candidatus Tokpelaia sp. TaxID=2233777 RepID=UPI003CC7F099